MDVQYHWTFSEDKEEEVCELEVGGQAVAYHMDSPVSAVQNIY